MATAILQQDKAGVTPAVDYFRPELICQVIDEDLGELGYLVIDRTIGTNPSGGGIRFARGLTVTEIAQLARSMTLKFAFLNLPTGGAKAGITFPVPFDKQMRNRVITSFGKHLRILLKRNVYFMGEDLGTTLVDLNLIQQAIGNAPYQFPEKKEGIGPTGMTVFESVKQCALSRGLKLQGATAVIEGFGRIGSEAALLMAEAGVEIRAVSTAQGAILNEKGFNVSKLMGYRNKYGDFFVHRFPDAETISPQDLLTMKTDILVPCARTWTINSGNADKINAKIIVSGANGPVSPDSEQTLFENGVLLMPDFVSSCGTILYSAMAARGFDDSAIKNFIVTDFSRKIGMMLKKAGEKKMCAAKYARSIAWRNFNRMNEMYSRPLKAGKKECLLCKIKEKGASGIWNKITRELNREIPFKAEDMRRAAYERFADNAVGEID